MNSFRFASHVVLITENFTIENHLPIHIYIYLFLNFFIQVVGFFMYESSCQFDLVSPLMRRVAINVAETLMRILHTHLALLPDFFALTLTYTFLIIRLTRVSTLALHSIPFFKHDRSCALEKRKNPRT